MILNSRRKSFSNIGMFLRDFLTLGGESHDFNIEGFRRLLNSFDAIFRRETSTALQRKSQKRISRQVLVCLPFVGLVPAPCLEFWSPEDKS